MTQSVLDLSSETQPAFPPVVPGNLILNGENPFIRLSSEPGKPFTSDASLWSISYSPKGSGHALFIKSELTQNQWRIYSDHPEMVYWLQSTVQGMLAPETAEGHIPIIEAHFSQQGDVQSEWVQEAQATNGDHIVLRWRNMIEPLLMMHEQPAKLPHRKYGVSVVMMPAQEADIMLNGKTAAGQVWPCQYDDYPFSTASLAFSESWRESS